MKKIDMFAVALVAGLFLLGFSVGGAIIYNYKAIFDAIILILQGVFVVALSLTGSIYAYLCNYPFNNPNQLFWFMAFIGVVLFFVAGFLIVLFEDTNIN